MIYYLVSLDLMHLPISRSSLLIFVQSVKVFQTLIHACYRRVRIVQAPTP